MATGPFYFNESGWVLKIYNHELEKDVSEEEYESRKHLEDDYRYLDRVSKIKKYLNNAVVFGRKSLK